MVNCKLNSIEILLDMAISHKEFVTILKEKYKYEKMKGNLISENEEYVSNDTICKAAYEIMRLSSVKSKI